MNKFRGKEGNVMNYIIPNDGETYKEYIARILNSRPNIKNDNIYQERHHITLKSCGGSNEENNLIYLYAQEHYYAHKMLALENPENINMQLAWWRMAQVSGCKNERNYPITPEEYAEARERMAQCISIINKGQRTGENHHLYGKQRSSEVKAKVSKANKGKHLGVENANHKSVMCNETGQVFQTITEAANWCGVGISTISSHLGGGVKKVKGKYTFTKIHN